MILIRLFLLGYVALSGAAGTAENEIDPAVVEYQAIISRFDEMEKQFIESYRAADAGKKKTILGNRPQPDQFIDQMIALARANQGKPLATKALVWATVRGMGRNRQSEMTLAELIANHLESKHLGLLPEYLSLRGDKNSLAALHQIATSSPHRDVQGNARIVKAEFDQRRLQAMQRGGNKRAASSRRELITTYRDLQKEFGGIQLSSGKTIALTAETQLFVLEKLAIGCVAPEIQGENEEGKTIRLSDYKGKVVLIDFWGDW